MKCLVVQNHHLRDRLQKELDPNEWHVVCTLQALTGNRYSLMILTEGWDQGISQGKRDHVLNHFKTRLSYPNGLMVGHPLPNSLETIPLKERSMDI